MAEDLSQYDGDIEAILGGSGIPLPYKTVTEILHDDSSMTRVIWVGQNGVTKSVGLWIRLTDSLIRAGKKFSQGIKIQLPEEPGNLWFFCLIEKEGDNETYYFVGGCTDFSGEGNSGRKLALRWLERTVDEILERNADWMITHLTDY